MHFTHRSKKCLLGHCDGLIVKRLNSYYYCTQNRNCHYILYSVHGKIVGWPQTVHVCLHIVTCTRATPAKKCVRPQTPVPRVSTNSGKPQHRHEDLGSSHLVLDLLFKSVSINSSIIGGQNGWMSTTIEMFKTAAFYGGSVHDDEWRRGMAHANCHGNIFTYRAMDGDDDCNKFVYGVIHNDECCTAIHDISRTYSHGIFRCNLSSSTVLASHDCIPQIISHQENNGWTWYERAYKRVLDCTTPATFCTTLLHIFSKYCLRLHRFPVEIPLLCSFVHFVIVISSIVEQGAGVTAPLSMFNDVFDPSGDPENAFMGMVSNYPNFVAEEWSHVLTWDLFVGRWIWLDGLRRGIVTAPAVLFCNLIGPPGLLIHWITSTISGKQILESSEKQEIENLE